MQKREMSFGDKIYFLATQEESNKAFYEKIGISKSTFYRWIKRESPPDSDLYEDKKLSINISAGKNISKYEIDRSDGIPFEGQPLSRSVNIVELANSIDTAEGIVSEDRDLILSLSNSRQGKSLIFQSGMGENLFSVYIPKGTSPENIRSILWANFREEIAFKDNSEIEVSLVGVEG